MPIPESVRPLRPFERDCLDLMELEGWAPLFAKVEDLGGWLEVPYTKDGKDLFLLISGTREPQMEELKALASKLDQREFERVVYARELPLSEDAAKPFGTAGVEVWHEALVATLAEAARRERVPSLGVEPSTFRLRDVHIVDFRGVADLALQLPAHGVVAFTGVNGAGKSTVLEAMVALLSCLYSVQEGNRFPDGIIRADQVRSGTEGAVLSARAGVGESADLTWSVAVQVSGKVDFERTDLVQVQRWLDRGEQVMKAVPTPSRSLIMGVPCTGRPPGHRVWAQQDFDQLLTWLNHYQGLENEARLSAPEFESRELGAMKRAMASVIGGVVSLNVIQSPRRLVVSKRGVGVLGVSQLSDGERRLIALAGRIAMELVRLNPSLRDPLLGGGVVLIDEFELHLHPGWQRAMLVNLEKTFPNIQFILTTHSPQVLSHIPAGNIFLLETREGKISVRQPPGVHGWDSNRILEILMDVPERPPEYKAALNRVSELLDARDLAAARRALDGVRAELGDNDLEIIRLQAVLEFLED